MSEPAADPEGPLAGLRVVEMAGLGPTPFAAMWLADMGAEVVRIERPGLKPLIPMRHDFLNRGRDFVALDLKNAEDLATARALIAAADMLIEGMRPGVMERLGLGPDVFRETNPALIYGRMTGWGQSGALAHTAGHDINYIGLTGALHAIGPAEGPIPPLNLVGDFGGGAMYLVAGMLAALHVARLTGRGQVVDCAITDGTSHLAAMIHGMAASGVWRDEREANLLDGHAPFYTTYECACGGFVAVGALEEQFYTEFTARLGFSPEELPDRADPANWPALRAIFARRFREKSRDEWARLMEGSDACTTPVLALREAPSHRHNRDRNTFIEIEGIPQPAPAPILSETPGRITGNAPRTPRDAHDILTRWRQETMPQAHAPPARRPGSAGPASRTSAKPRK